MLSGPNLGAFPVAPGQPSYSGVFIPAIWSGVYLPKFYAASVFPMICNTDYEGQLRNYGDTIYVPVVPEMAIHQYVDGQDLVLDRPTATNEEFTIKKGHYFNALVTDLANKQSNIPFLDKWSTDAAMRMQIAIDRRLLAEVPLEADVFNAGATAGKISGDINLGETGSPLAITRANAIDTLMKGVQCLQEQNVPTGDGQTFAVVPPWFATELKLSDLKAAYLTGDSTSPIRTGNFGPIDSLDNVYVSTNLMPITDGANKAYYILVGHKMAMTFASQLSQLETIRAANTFGDIMRGFQIYDYKVMVPQALTAIYCYYNQS